jgi:hypothetical protein
MGGDIRKLRKNDQTMSKPLGAKFDWNPVEYLDGIYWELKTKTGFFCLFGLGDGLYELSLSGGYIKAGTIQEIESSVNE